MSREAGRPRGVWRSAGLAVGWGLVGAGAALALLYLVPEVQLVHRWAALATAFLPFAAVVWALALVVLVLAARGWGKLLGLVAVPGLVLAVLWAQPYWPAGLTGGTDDAGAPVGGGGGVVGTVMTFNARCESTWVADLRDTILAQQPDVVVLQGAATRLRERVVESGVAEAYPHRAFVYEMAGLPSCGTVVLSRLPLVWAGPLSSEQPVLGIDLGFGPVTLVPVDVPGPQDGLGPWRDAIDGVGAAVEGVVAGGGGPVVVAGDFNAVREHEPMRRLLELGLESAAEQAGAGWVPTYPADLWYPPVVAIDHVLLGPGLEAVGVETVRIGGCAHLGLVVQVRVR